MYKLEKLPIELQLHLNSGVYFTNPSETIKCY